MKARRLVRDLLITAAILGLGYALLRWLGAPTAEDEEAARRACPTCVDAPQENDRAE